MEEQLKAALGIESVFTLDGVVLAYYSDLSGSDNCTRLDDKDAWITTLSRIKDLEIENAETLYASPSIVSSLAGVNGMALCKQLGYGDSSYAHCTLLWVIVGGKKWTENDKDGDSDADKDEIH